MGSLELIRKAPEDARFKLLRNVQNLRSRNSNEEVRFSERYEIEYMGSTEFECGYLSQRLRDLAEFGRVAQIMVDGVLMLTLYDKRHFNMEGAEYAVARVYDGTCRTQDFTGFDQRSRREADLKRRQRDGFSRLKGKELERDAWMDIDHGIFWTWRRINIRGVLRNIRKSVEYMDQQVKPRDQAT